MYIISNSIKIKFKISNNIGFKHKFYFSQAYLLSSCSARIILIASGLWFAQTSALKAMEPIIDTSLDRDEKSLKSKKFYRDAYHPLTQEFWRERDLSVRLEKLKEEIKRKRHELINSKTNSITISAEELIKYKIILKCQECEKFPTQVLNDIHFHSSIKKYIDRDNSQTLAGWTNAEVMLFPHKRENSPVESQTNGGKSTNLIAIKKFTNIEKGLEELLSSLIALDINPDPEKIKMARIYDAVICPENHLSIIMEAVGTHDIHTYLSTGGEGPISAVKACAEYLATFHIENYCKLKKINSQKYLDHVAQFYNSLLQDTLEEEDKIYKLLTLNPREYLSDDKHVQSNNIIFLLSEEKQKEFIRLVKRNSDLFEENAGEIFRLRKNNQELYYNFLTINHGDAHLHNFFYNAEKLILNDKEIPLDSFLRMSMIDYASIIKTYGGIGQPEEDVGRILAALWNWRAIEENHTDEEALKFQDIFINKYLDKIKQSQIIKKENQECFEKRFKNICSFYKLRYFRVLFNAQKDKKNLEKDREIKKKFLESWIQENADLESSSELSNRQIVIQEKPKDRSWKPVCMNQNSIIHWLPDRSNEFIESANQESETSYLTGLWKMLEDTGNVTLSSAATIAGMGGVGKTSLALEYACEALKNNAYNLIYWIHSGSEISLINGYKSLLQKMGVSIENTGSDIIKLAKLVKQEMVKPAWGRCLLIFDNVPDPSLLEDKTPKNKKTHILMTSRCNEGWHNPTLNLDVFRLEDSLKYLFQITGLERTDENKMIAGDLAEALGHFPLALSHAAHYLKLVGGDEVSKEHFRTYVDDLERGIKKDSLIPLKENINPLKTKKLKITYENLIQKTLGISRKYISEVTSNSNPVEDLLAYCSYLSSDSIAEDIFLERWQTNELNDALSQLSSLSLIKRAQNEPLFSIHRLIQFVLRNEKESKPDHHCGEVLLQIVPIFNKIFADNIYTEEQIKKLSNYFPHFLHLVIHANRLNLSLPEIQILEWIRKFMTFLFMVENDEDYTKEDFQSNSDIRIQSYHTNIIRLFSHLKRDDFVNDLTKNINIPDCFEELFEESTPEMQSCLGTMYSIPQRSIQYSLSEISRSIEKAFYWYKKAARKGFLKAQNNLGDLYKFEKNYAKAVEWYLKATDKGLPTAQCGLGLLYREGKGVQQDYAKAMEWFLLAAKQNNSSALYNCGELFYNMQDYSEAAKSYLMAADRGLRAAQFKLGLLHVEGKGVQQDYIKAMEWYLKAAEQNHLGAQLILGMFYESSYGVRQDYSEAAKWYLKAADQGLAKAQFNLGSLYAKGHGVQQDYAKAMELFLKAAEQNHPSALVNLGWLYENGHGVKQDYAKAIEWYLKAAEQNNADAQYALGLFYYNGYGVKQDYAKAMEWYLKAAEQNNADAQYALGCLYYKGQGVLKDKKKAIELLHLAANKGLPEAQCYLGVHYLNGQGVPKNEKKALEFFHLAANKGVPEAQFNLGWLYYYGRGVAPSNSEAFECFKKAADQGNVSAQWMLAAIYTVGEEGTQNNGEALRWLEKVTEGQAQDEFKSEWLNYSDDKATHKTGTVRWIKKAAKQGYVVPQFMLGYMYYYGDGVLQNKAKALEWFALAAKQGHESAKSILETLSFNEELRITTKETDVDTQGEKESVLRRETDGGINKKYGLG